MVARQWVGSLHVMAAMGLFAALGLEGAIRPQRRRVMTTRPAPPAALPRRGAGFVAGLGVV